MADETNEQQEELETPEEGAAGAEEPVAEEPVAEEPLADESVGEDSAAEEPVAEEPAAEEPVADEPVSEEPAAEEPAAEEPAKPARRRRSAETSTAPAPKKAAPRRPDGAVVVKASAKYVRTAPRKARLVMDHIRGKEVEQARAILTHAPRHAAEDILKLLNSAIANAESAYELGPEELRIVKAFVDEGPTIKRFRPRALGRATPIKKRTSHMTIELTTTTNGR
jgi:large subunit ribosomal protein L22